MRQSFFAFMLLLGLVFGSCKKDDYQQQLPFVARVEIPAGLGTLLTYNFRADDLAGVPSIVLTKAQVLEMRIYTEQGENNFNYVRQAFVEVVTDTSRLEIGYNTDVIANSSNSISLFPNEADIKEYLMQPNFDLSLRFNFRNNTAQTSVVRMEMIVGVNE